MLSTHTKNQRQQKLNFIFIFFTIYFSGSSVDFAIFSLHLEGPVRPILGAVNFLESPWNEQLLRFLRYSYWLNDDGLHCPKSNIVKRYVYLYSKKCLSGTEEMFLYCKSPCWERKLCFIYKKCLPHGFSVLAKKLFFAIKSTQL